MLKLTKRELKTYNGIKGKVLIAYKKNIYDVSESPLYKFGNHFNHETGYDLTEFLADAPHFEEVLDKFPIIGELI